MEALQHFEVAASTKYPNVSCVCMKNFRDGRTKTQNKKLDSGPETLGVQSSSLNSSRSVSCMQRDPKLRA